MAEIALRDSEARLKRAQKIAHMGDFEWDEVTDEAIYRSDVIADIYGLPPEQVPRSFEEILESYIRTIANGSGRRSRLLRGPAGHTT